ncbi:retrovirus-related pol polyprotein from transposon TNT 1-94 [Tanacetum coccineum]
MRRLGIIAVNLDAQWFYRKTSGSDKPRHPVLQMLWGIYDEDDEDRQETIPTEEGNEPDLVTSYEDEFETPQEKEKRKEGKEPFVTRKQEVAHSLANLSKKKRTTEQFVFARRDQTPPDSTTGPSSQPEDDTSEKVVHESSSTSDSERTESDTESGTPKGDKVQGEIVSSTVTSGVSIPVSVPEKAHVAQAGPHPEPMQEDQTGSDSGKLHVSLAGPNPEHMDDEFIATAYPKVHENLKLITGERVVNMWMRNLGLKNKKELYENKGCKERSPPFSYADTGSNHIAFRNTKMIADNEDRQHGPSDQMHNPPTTQKSLKRFLFHFSQRLNTLSIELSHSELVDIEKDTYPILLSFTHCGNKSFLRVLRIILVILPEHPSETIVVHNEDGNPARANIKLALGYLKDGDGDGNSQYLRCQVSKLPQTLMSLHSSQGNNMLSIQDDVRLCLDDDLKKAQDHSQRQMRALLIQHGCEAALEVLPADMEAQTKIELNKKAHSAMILCLGMFIATDTQPSKVKVINGSRVILSGIRRDNCVYFLDGHVMTGGMSLITSSFKHEAIGNFKGVESFSMRIKNLQKGRTVKKLRMDNAIEKKTPMEMWSGHPSDYRMLRIYAVSHIHTINKTRLKDSSAVDNSIEELQVEVELAEVILALTACKDYELEQLDVKMAFLHGNLKEVDLHGQPSGIKTRTTQGSSIATTTAAKAEIGSTKSLLKKEFDMKELGEAKKILGMEIVRDRSRKILRVSQSGYVSKILNNFRIDNGKSVKMPLGGHFKLSLKDCPVRDCDVERMSKVPYANAVESLMYLMVCTRPDIAYAVSVVSRYLANPGKNHWEAVKWILKYLRGTANVGLVYGTDRGNHVDVTGFVDSDYAKDPDKGRSITGYAFLVQGCVVSWKATLQYVVTLSTTEAEYVALTEAVNEAIWLKGLLEELGVELNTVAVNSDNQGAIHLSRNHVFHKRTKHINVCYHFIREVLEAKTVKVLKVGTKHNVVDALTKMVPGLKLQHCLELLNVGVG